MTNKISDFGQKIGGARKDLIKEFAERFLGVTNNALITQPLSKVFRLPDLRKLYVDGVISKGQARAAWYVWDSIEAKPSRTYRLESWANETYIKLQNIIRILQGERVNLETNDHKKRALFFQEIKTAGWPEQEYTRGVYRVEKHWYRDCYTVATKREYKGYYNTIAEAVAGLRALTAKKETDLAKRFAVYTYKSKKIYFICPKGKTGINLFQTENLEEARDMVKNHAEKLQEIYDKLRTFPDERRDWNRPRTGADYRNGLDLTPDAFTNILNFRGVEFGNWLNQLERSAALNECADALQDLAGVLQIKLEDITQAGTLAMAFGSRGISGAAAHYEPIKRVINLTKRAGAGCLAHEWWHALDNYIMTLQGEKSLYAVADYRQLQDENLKAVAADLYRGIYNSPFADRSRKTDTYKSKKYWGTMVELSARAFEAYVREKLEKAGYCNDYLVNYKTMDEYSRADFYPYPTNQETEALEPLFDAFFSALFTDRADGLKPVQTQEPEAAETMANDAAPEDIPAAASESMADSPAYGSSEKSLTDGAAYGDSEKSLFYSNVPRVPERFKNHIQALDSLLEKYLKRVKTDAICYDNEYHYFHDEFLWGISFSLCGALLAVIYNAEKGVFYYQIFSENPGLREGDVEPEYWQKTFIEFMNKSGFKVVSEDFPVTISEPETNGTAYGETEKSLYPGALYGNLQKSLILQEYEKMKKPDSERLIMFRLRDHYGVFNDDAGKAAGILGIPLSEIQGIPFAAFRHYELDTYLPRLIRHGVRVGIVDSSPLEQKKVISRTGRTTTE